MIEVKNLTKKYDKKLAVDNISFKIHNGKIYGLLGENGAGKSTTMNILTGCLSPTSGSVNINGFDIYENALEAKSLIGYLPEIPPLYPDMTPYEYLLFVAEAKHVRSDKIGKQVKSAMEQTGITDVQNRLIKNLSKGYKQRVGIAQALLGNPEIIILDEPTVGLDPKQIIEIRDLIRKLGKNKTVILSSHILAEISAVCDHVIIISNGRIVADGDMSELEGMIEPDDKYCLTVRGDRTGVSKVLGAFSAIIEKQIDSIDDATLRVNIKVRKGNDIRDDIFFSMAENRYAVIEMEKAEATLENIFLSLTNVNAESRPGEIADTTKTEKSEDKPK